MWISKFWWPLFSHFRAVNLVLFISLISLFLSLHLSSPESSGSIWERLKNVVSFLICMLFSWWISWNYDNPCQIKSNSIANISEWMANLNFVTEICHARSSSIAEVGFIFSRITFWQEREERTEAARVQQLHHYLESIKYYLKSVRIACGSCSFELKR